MPTYNAAAVADAIIAHKKGITLQQGRALRDNPIAAFSDADATSRAAGIYNASGWHPAGTFPLYDFTRDGGVTGTAIETAAFADGWEYMMVGRNLSTTGTGSFTFDLYRETSAAYTTLLTLNGALAAAQNFEFVVEMSLPRMLANRHVGRWRTLGSASFSNAVDAAVGYSDWSMTHATQQKIGKARLTITSTTDAGTIWLLRRAEYLS